MGELTDEDVNSWFGYLNAHKSRRLFFKKLGATATDHGHPTARTENLSQNEAEKLFELILTGNFTRDDADKFRGQMLTEMAKMSCDDGLGMQIHPCSIRNHSNKIFNQFGFVVLSLANIQNILQCWSSLCALNGLLLVLIKLSLSCKKGYLFSICLKTSISNMLGRNTIPGIFFPFTRTKSKNLKINSFLAAL